MKRVFYYFKGREEILKQDIDEIFQENGISELRYFDSEAAIWEALNHHPPALILMHIGIRQNLHHVDLIHRIRSRWGIPVLVVFGGIKEEIQGFISQFSSIRIIQKPFLPHQIMDEAQTLLATIRPETGSFPYISPKSLSRN